MSKDSYRCEKCGGVVSVTVKTMTIKQVKAIHDKDCPGRFR